VIAEQEETAREEQAAPYVTIILPCYNEEGHVIAEIERISAAMDASGHEYELVCVNDASTDDTLAKLYEAAPRFPKMEVVNFHRNSGSGTVRRIGTQRARGEIVVWTDADMTYPNERIPELVQILEKDPNSIDLFDPMIKKALNGLSADGHPTGMTIPDFENMLRAQPAWGQTANAQNAAMTTANGVLQNLGLVG